MKTTSESPEREALIELSLATGVGPVTLREIRAAGRTFAEASHDPQYLDGSDLRARRIELQRSLDRLGARTITALDADYPPALHDLRDPPAVLFAKGNLALLQRPIVAVVGTRTCTAYGERVSANLGASLAAAGACVVSGMAKGIDAAAHRGALDFEASTCAILGTGMDMVFPAEHASLQRTIGERGLLLSEYLPGIRPHDGSFPRRNRIIAALARVTIVVECPFRSGALRTAEIALALHRTVAAVPGPIDAANAAGSNQLLRDGATLLANVDEAVTLAGLVPLRANATSRKFTRREKAVLRALERNALTTEQIIEVTGLPVAQALSVLGELEVEGLIETIITGEIQRRPGTTVPRSASVQ